jgi:hypothetical protein
MGQIGFTYAVNLAQLRDRQRHCNGAIPRREIGKDLWHMSDSSFKLDKTAFSSHSLKDEGNDKEYWLSKTPLERLAAGELMRQINYGYNPITDRVQGVYQIIELK